MDANHHQSRCLSTKQSKAEGGCKALNGNKKHLMGVLTDPEINSG